MRIAGLAFLLLAGSTTQSWAGISDFRWMMIFIGCAAACFAADFLIRWRRARFKAAVEREISRRIYHYRKMDY